MDIEYAVTTCELGELLVARSEQGICAIALGDSADQLTIDLQRVFVNPRQVKPAGRFASHVQQVTTLIEQPSLPLPTLPLDIKGTEFQRQVWQALQSVKAGHTVTYSGLAQLLGRPTAARAVANACGANTLAVVIPCHRVIRSDGSLSGYRWGVKRKQELLKREIGL
ncbi:methylated-DNA--[protein]-cysteine S-methyltransferase [Gilvimarinus polysaccharolyticus]|uniref:methylated-DNA--[protein]-cysteine S-methyltransferase n=1 Tax=Gilvimarinus polysaccharolyticus TaxID=863921 RepID=UPI0006731961|nr:methylated-DNA--[protein]-cysteine S-methyltransferase [Gilvimarinus polysaccharolyticus]